VSEPATATNAGQRAAWDGDEGAHWVEHAERYEASTAGHRAHLWDAVTVEVDAEVLDIGCGTGVASRTAGHFAHDGMVLGVDLSAAMLAHAEDRTAAAGLTNVTYLQADAQTHPFAAGGADLVISCFGAMFFDDQRAAFANLARALRPGGRLAALVWQGLQGNEWLQCIRGALSTGRDLPPPPVGRAGPFGLADPDAIRAVLAAAGFTTVDLLSVEEPMRFGADADDAFAFLRDQGATVGMLGDLDERARAAALDALHDTLRDHETPNGVCFASRTWLILATG